MTDEQIILAKAALQVLSETTGPLSSIYWQSKTSIHVGTYITDSDWINLVEILRTKGWVMTHKPKHRDWAGYLASEAGRIALTELNQQ